MRTISPLFPTEFPKILVPVDCSPMSALQVEAAAALAFPMAGVRLTVLAQTPDQPQAPDSVRRSWINHADSALAEAARHLTSCGTYCVRTRRAAKTLPEAVVAELESGKYQLLVLTESFANRPMDESDPCGVTWAGWLSQRISIPLVIAPEAKHAS